MAITRARVNLAILLCSVSGALYLGGCGWKCGLRSKSALKKDDGSGPRVLKVIGVFGNDRVSESEVHVWAKRMDNVLWFAPQTASVVVSFSLSASQKNPFTKMICDKLEGQVRSCTVNCPNEGTCVAGDIVQNLTYPPKPNNFLSYSYEVTLGEGAKADPVIIIHETQ